MDTIVYFASPAEMRTELQKIKRRQLNCSHITHMGNNIIIKGFPSFSLSGYHYDRVIKIDSYSNAYERLIVDRYPSDISIIVKDKHFLLHRIILSLTSDYFRSLGWESGQQVVLSDTDPDLFQQLVDLIYGNYVPIRSIEDLRLLSLIRKFKIHSVDVDAIITNFAEPASCNFKRFIEIINSIYPDQWSPEIQLCVDQIIDSYNDQMLGPDFFKEIVPLLPLSIQPDYHCLLEVV